jgi:NAD(P)-dependent dehydrogenase (short-subunit alcohol dehydrogenase family)
VIDSILDGKIAVVFGAGGSIGTAVATAFVSEGAEVFLSGRNGGGLEALEKEIASAGGRAHSKVVDALDDDAVQDYLQAVAGRAGRIDIALNATGPRVSEYGNGKHAVDLSVEEFAVPVNTVLKSQFITARGAARHMVTQGDGVIILLTGSPAKPHLPGTTAIGAAFGAVETLTRTMAIELGPAGVRVVCLRTAANPDSRTIQETADLLGNMRDAVFEGLAASTMLRVSPTTADTARAAVALAGDRLKMMTGTVLNASAGAVPD